MSQTTSAPRSQRGCAVLLPSLCAAASYGSRALSDRHPRVSRRSYAVRHKRYATCCTRSTREASRVCSAEKRAQVRAILHQSPRTFGQLASVWTLKRRAEVCHEQGLSDTTLAGPTMLEAIVRVGLKWPRATHWIVSPDPAYERTKTPRPPDPDGRQPAGQGAGLRR